MAALHSSGDGCFAQPSKVADARTSTIDASLAWIPITVLLQLGSDNETDNRAY
jgi:hypothetical protein